MQSRRRPIDPSSEGKQQPLPGRSPIHFQTPIMKILSISVTGGDRFSLLRSTGAL